MKEVVGGFFSLRNSIFFFFIELMGAIFGNKAH